MSKDVINKITMQVVTLPLAAQELLIDLSVLANKPDLRGCFKEAKAAWRGWTYSEMVAFEAA